MKVPGMDVVQGKGLASALGSTPLYSRHSYAVKAYVVENRNKFFIKSSSD
jgi:hypothetical protein